MPSTRTSITLELHEEPDDLSELTDGQLYLLEENLYDDERSGLDTWEQRNKVIIEINKRKLPALPF